MYLLQKIEIALKTPLLYSQKVGIALKIPDPFQNDVRVQRRRAGITPHLPPMEEREEIKRHHLERMKANAENT